MPTEVEITQEDIARTQGRILNSYQEGHGITLAPREVEVLVSMMQGFEMLTVQARFNNQQTQHLLGAVLHHLSEAAGPEALAFPGEIMDVNLAGYSAEWDEIENVITFSLVYNPETVEDDEADDEEEIEGVAV